MYKICLGVKTVAWFMIGFILYKSILSPYGLTAFIVSGVFALCEFMLLVEEISIERYEGQSKQKSRKKKVDRNEMIKRSVMHTVLYLGVVLLIVSILKVNKVDIYREVGIALAFVACLLGMKGV